MDTIAKKRIAVLGIESSHAWYFIKKILFKEEPYIYEELELAGVFGDPATPGTDIGIEIIKAYSENIYFANTYDAFVDTADAVIITARDGSQHLTYAIPYLKKGIPLFIDKPTCCSAHDAKELIKLAKQYSTPICGGSSLIFSKQIRDLHEYVKNSSENIQGGHVTAPIYIDSPHGGFWFYAQHLVQMMIDIFGPQVRSVKAHKINNKVHALYRYDDFAVTACFGSGYTVTVYGNNKQICSSDISLDGCQEAEWIEFQKMLHTGQGISNYELYIAPVHIIEATIKAYQSNIEQSIF